VADSPLQKAPSGLLGAFDLKTLGQQPTKFGELVQPSVEVIDMYVPLTIAEKTLNVTNPDIEVADTFDVPNGELWLVRAWAWLGTAPAADLAKNVNVWASFNNAANQVGVGGTTASNVPASGRRSVGAWLTDPIWLRPGWGFLIGVGVSVTPAVAIPGTMSIAYQRIIE